MKTFMVIEYFKPGCVDKTYERFHQQGRMLPEGLFYLNSWVNKEQHVCYQLMETQDESLFQTWISHWEDLVEFEVVPID